MCFSFILRKFLCLGNPLMCLGEKMPNKLKKANNQPDKDSLSNGELFMTPIYLTFSVELLLEFSDGLKYNHEPVAHEILCFSKI